MKLFRPTVGIISLFALSAGRSAESVREAAPSPYRGTPSFQSDRNGNWDLFLSEADGSGLTPLSRHPADDVQPDWSPDHPAFSPDGHAMALASTIERQPERWDLYLVQINARNLFELTSGPANDRFPTWRAAVR